MSVMCTKCGASPVNATGVFCDSCMISDGGIFKLPTNEAPKVIEPIRQPTATDEVNDQFDSFTKSFNDGLEIKVIINYTKNFSEIAIFKNGILTDTKTYTDKEVFESTLKNAIDTLNAQEEERLRKIEEQKKYFEDIKSVVSDLGFDTIEDSVEPDPEDDSTKTPTL